MIGEELDKENPNYYLIGAMGGLGAVATIIGLVPGAGDVAQKAIMQGTRMMAEKSGQLTGELTGAARAIRDGDLEFLLARGNAGNTQGVGADVVRKDRNKAVQGDLDPAKANGGQGVYKNKAPNYVDEIEVLGKDQGLLVPEKPLDIERMVGTTLVPVPGDRTRAGFELEGIRGATKDYDFEETIDLQGGRGFMRYPDSGVWASIPSAMEKKARLAGKIAEEGGEPRLIYSSMGPQASDFSTMMSDTVMEMMKTSKITKKSANEFDNWVMDNVDPNWTGIKNSSTKEYLRGMNGSKRREIWQQMDAGDWRKKGFPEMGDARVAITDPDLLTEKTLRTTSVGRINPTGKLLTGPTRLHDTYSSQVGGEYLGELPVGVPADILLRKFLEGRRAAGKPKGSDGRSVEFNSSMTSEFDTQMLDEVMEYVELQDAVDRQIYIDNLPKNRELKTYNFGDNSIPAGVGPIDDQMGSVFSDPLQIGRNKAAEGGAFLKNYTAADANRMDTLIPTASAGNSEANKKIMATVTEGRQVGIRLNLNSKLDQSISGRSGDNMLQTIHNKNYNGEALSYQTYATVEDVTFNVNQKHRVGISANINKVDVPEAKNKHNAMSVDGKMSNYRNVLDEMDETVVEIGFSPRNNHLFIDMKTGQAVEGADVATVIGDRVYAKGVRYMKKSDAPEPLAASDGTVLPNEVWYKMYKGGFMVR